MSYQVLARKWRPKKFEDVVGQSHIAKSLQNALKRNQIGHAYILTGTRGIGKTTIARIFAKALRCDQKQEDSNPCGTCNSCLDFDSQSSMNVIEIDGASNNSVDDIRDLISNVQYLPTVGEYKVYIIDEVHMLSTSAFNALLKTLEEPPKHAVFILATTEPEKLLGTVLSRCQRFDFRNATLVDLVGHVKKIAEKEGIQFENDELIQTICIQGNGSFRDTLSLVDQVLSFSEDKIVSEEVVAMALGIAKTSAILTLINNMFSGQDQQACDLVEKFISENISTKNILSSILSKLFDLIKDHQLPEGISEAEALWVYESLAKDANWILDSLLPPKSLQIVVKKISLRRSFFTEGATLGGQVASADSQKKTLDNSPVDKQETQSVNETVEITPQIEVSEESPSSDKLVAKEQEPSPVKEVPEEEVTPSIDIRHKIQEAMEEKSTEEVQVDQPIVAPVEEVVLESGEKSWEGFLKSLAKISPAAASNLEQGNLVTPINVTELQVSVDFAYSSDGKVFYDYMIEDESQKKLVDNLKKYFGCDDVHLSITLLDDEKADEANFISRAAIKEEEEQKVHDNKRDEILNDPIIQNAQDIFSAKVDKVIVDKK